MTFGPSVDFRKVVLLVLRLYSEGFLLVLSLVPNRELADGNPAIAIS